MPLKITYEQLRNPAFGSGMMKLSNCPSYKSQKTAYNIARINDRILKEAKIADELYQKLVNQYAAKDEAGKLKPHDGKLGTFFIPDEDAEAWKAAIKDFLAVEVEIQRHPIDLADVAEARLTPLEIATLDTVVTFDEEPKLAEVKPLQATAAPTPA